MKPPHMASDPGVWVEVGPKKTKKEAYLKSLGLLKDGPFLKECKAILNAMERADKISPSPTFERGIRASEIHKLIAGKTMEETNQLLKAINEETKESKRILENLANEITAISHIIQPRLLDQAKAIRDARMTTVSEINQCLSAMREVRKFFFESDYEIEMARLERFVKLCRDIQELKAAGVFDAVCDAAVRLAVKEESER